MNQARKRKLIAVVIIFAGVAIAVGLALYALRQNVNLFYTPSQVIAHEAPTGKHFRIGGMVTKGSVHRNKESLQVSFDITDTANLVTVTYNGILPDLFREGQGIVAEGQLNKQGVFVASTVLAKHDSTYMPPEVKHALLQAQKKRQQ